MAGLRLFALFNIILLYTLLNFIVVYCITAFPAFFTVFPCNLILFNVLMIFYVLSGSTWHLVLVPVSLDFYDFLVEVLEDGELVTGRKSK